jgi:hypothetical protein
MSALAHYLPKLANAFARRRKDRIGQRRHDARGPNFADPARRCGAINEMHIDRGHLVDAQCAVVAEVGLLDPTVLEG